jgi:hypothetical protein
MTRLAQMSHDERVAALRRGARSPAERAAVEILVGVNNGALVDLDAVYLTLFLLDTHLIRVDWHELWDRCARGEVPDPGKRAVELACAIAWNTEMERLGSALSSFQQTDAAAVLRAFAIALGLADPDGEAG